MLQLRTSKQKLLATFGVLTLLTAVVGGVALWSLERLEGHVNALAGNLMPSTAALSRAQSGFLQARLATARATISGQEGDFRAALEHRSARDQAVKDMEAGLHDFAALPMPDRVKEQWKGIEEGEKYFAAETLNVWSMLEKRDGLGAVMAQGKYVAEVQRRVAEPLEKLTAIQTVLSDEEHAAADAVAQKTRALLWSTLAVALLLAAVLAVLMARSVSRPIALLVSEAARLREAVVEGRLRERGDAGLLSQEFRPVLEGINLTMDAFTRPIAVTTDYVTRISKGDIPPAITDAYQGDFNEIKEALNRCAAAVNALVADAGMLAKAGVEGRLATRADASRHQGDFRKVVQGVNDTLDAVIGPLNVAATYVDQISKGRIPEKITASYQGDFNTIKENLNRCVEAVNRLVSDAGALAQAGVEGRLATRADASRHEGDFRKIVEGVNRTLDSVIGPLNVAARYVAQISKGEVPEKIADSYAGDFNAIKDNLNTCIDAIDLLVADAGKLVQAAVAGQLSTRADASRHQGDFRQIVGRRQQDAGRGDGAHQRVGRRARAALAARSPRPA